MTDKPLNPVQRFFKWVRQTVDTLCDRPDHLQRIAITCAGVSLYPMLFLVVALLVWFGVHPAPNAGLVIPIFGNLGYGLLGVFAIVIISLLGTIKGIRFTAPGGAGVEIATTSSDGLSVEASPANLTETT